MSVYKIFLILLCIAFVNAEWVDLVTNVTKHAETEPCTSGFYTFYGRVCNEIPVKIDAYTQNSDSSDTTTIRSDNAYWWNYTFPSDGAVQLDVNTYLPNPFYTRFYLDSGCSDEIVPMTSENMSNSEECKLYNANINQLVANKQHDETTRIVIIAVITICFSIFFVCVLRYVATNMISQNKKSSAVVNEV